MVVLNYILHKMILIKFVTKAEVPDILTRQYVHSTQWVLLITMHVFVITFQMPVNDSEMSRSASPASIPPLITRRKTARNNSYKNKDKPDRDMSSARCRRENER